MNAVCDEEGRWWVINEETGDPIRGPFDTEEEAWDVMDEIPEDELEIGRLADRFNTELTRTSFNLSLQLEEEK